MFIGLINTKGELLWHESLEKFKTDQEIEQFIAMSGIDGSEKVCKLIKTNYASYSLRVIPVLKLNNEVAIILVDKVNHVTEPENSIFKSLFNIPYEGLIFVDKYGFIREVNDAFCKYLDLKKEDLVGHNIGDYKIDPALLNVIETGKPDYLTFYPQPKLIASRQPVMLNGEIIGVLGRYGALDVNCIRRNILDADQYIDIISRLQAKDILINVNNFLAELNSYREDFEQANTVSSGIHSIIGNSPIMQALKETIQTIAFSPSSVLITGESGTGKELFAQAIHYHGDRSEYPFVKVNCAAIPDNLLESELFGYVEGAFTGAKKGGKMGKFELADGGTIFLDEIGDMPVPMQAKLLRVLQEREIERIGDEKTIPINIRIISASNSDLKELINKGRFRPDLYYRLNVVHIHIPPLRDRREDIVEIIWHTVNNLNIKLKKNINKITQETIDVLTQYDWPGNVRELINVLETAMNFCQSNQLETDVLPMFLKNHAGNINTKAFKLNDNRLAADKQQIIKVLEKTKGNRNKASAMLGISRTTLYRLMKKYSLL